MTLFISTFVIITTLLVRYKRNTSFINVVSGNIGLLDNFRTEEMDIYVNSVVEERGLTGFTAVTITDGREVKEIITKDTHKIKANETVHIFKILFPSIDKEEYGLLIEENTLTNLMQRGDQVLLEKFNENHRIAATIISVAVNTIIFETISPVAIMKPFLFYFLLYICVCLLGNGLVEFIPQKKYKMFMAVDMDHLETLIETLGEKLK